MVTRPARPVPAKAKAKLSPLALELGKRKPFESGEQEAYLNVMRTQSLLAAGFDALFKPFGVSEATFNALRILRGVGPAGCACSRIAEQLVTRVPDVTRLVDRLELARLVGRTRIEEDRRVVLISITRAGLDLLAKLDRRVLRLHHEQLGHLSASELRTLNRLLAKARSATPVSKGALRTDAARPR